MEVCKCFPHPAINLHVHTCAWKYFGVRPSGAAARRDKTRPEYRGFDETHEDYVYTEAWVKKLSKDLAESSDLPSDTTRRAVWSPDWDGPLVCLTNLRIHVSS